MERRIDQVLSRSSIVYFPRSSRLLRCLSFLACVRNSLPALATYVRAGGCVFHSSSSQNTNLFVYQAPKTMPDRLEDPSDSAIFRHHSDDMDRPSMPQPVWLVPAQPITPSTPCLRAGHSLAAFSNRIYLFGGYCDYASYVASRPPNVDQLMRGARPGIGLHFNSLHEYSIDTQEWRILHSGCHPHEARGQALPKPRRHASMVVHGGSLFVYGGFDVDDTVLPDLWEFRVETSTWTIIPPSSPALTYSFVNDQHSIRRSHVPVARAEHTAVVDGNRMIVFGGYDGKKKLNDTYVFDFAAKEWHRPNSADCNAPHRRCKHSAVLYKRNMYVVGGFQFKDGDNYALTDMHVLDLDSFSWSTVLMGNTCPEALQGHKAVVCGDSMYILGGKVRVRSRYSLPTSGGLGHTHGGPQSNIPSNGEVSTPNMSLVGMPQLPPSSLVNMSSPSQASSVDLPMQNGMPNMQAPVSNPAHVALSAAAAADNRSSGLNSTVFRYVFESNRWSTVETSGKPPTPRQLHAAVALPSGGGRMAIFMFGGTDRSKQRFFHDLCELRGIRSTVETARQPCETCSGTKTLLDNKMFSDVRFIVEGRAIHAHRCILYARSEYFRNMFDSRMRETSEKDIPIPDVAYDVFLAVLEYLYSGTVRMSSGKLAVELLKAADMFRIEGLRNLCVEKVEQAVTVENAAFICQVADMHNALNLKQFCITFMIQNFREVIKSPSFQSVMRQDPGGLGHEILEAYSDSSPYASGTKRPRK